MKYTRTPYIEPPFCGSFPISINSSSSSNRVMSLPPACLFQQSHHPFSQHRMRPTSSDIASHRLPISVNKRLITDLSALFPPCLLMFRWCHANIRFRTQDNLPPGGRNITDIPQGINTIPTNVIPASVSTAILEMLLAPIPAKERKGVH